MSIKQPVFRFLDTVGDGTGEKNAIGDYSSVPQEFKLAPKLHEGFFVAQLIVLIAVNGALGSGVYGGGGMGNDPLTNGVQVYKKKLSVVTANLTDGVTVKSSGDWLRFGPDVEVMDFGPGDNHIMFRFTVVKNDNVLALSGNDKESLVVSLSDDFTGLTKHYFMAHGHRHTEQ